jgi:glutamate racemase
MRNKPIGIFDSGVGGTSILKEIHALLPNEAIIYLADSENAPYGNKSESEIIQLSIKNTEFLLNNACKLIVVACNTATTNAISYLRSTYDVPFIGIEPAIKPAALNTNTKAIGILATKGTLSSALFHKTSDLYAHNIKVIERVGEGIVPLIESGKLDSQEMVDLLKIHIAPMLKQNIDYLVLGCTHYPYLIPMLSKMLPKHVKIIDSGLAVAKQTKNILVHHDLFNQTSKKGIVNLYTNGDLDVINALVDHKFTTTKLHF